MSENVKLIVEGREVVELHINDRGVNEIDDNAGEGSLNSTWSADKLFNLFKELDINNEDVIQLLQSKVDKQEGMGLSETSFTQEEKDKLLDVAVGATKNALDSFLLDRGNHTGVQSKSSVEGLVDDLNTIVELIDTLQSSTTEDITSINEKLNKKVDVVDGMGLSANNFTDTLKELLESVQEGATKNESDEYLLNRTNHTGVAPVDSVEGLQSLIDDVSVLSSNITSTQEDVDSLHSKIGDIDVGLDKILNVSGVD